MNTYREPLIENMKRFASEINSTLKKNMTSKYIAWQFYQNAEGITKPEIVGINCTDDQTLNAYRAKGWVVLDNR